MTIKTDDHLRALGFIQNQHLMHLATVDEYDQPEVASVLFYCHDDFSIYFSTRSSGRKFSNLQTHPTVGFTITNETDYITVQGQGQAQIITNPTEIGQMITHLAGIVGSEQPMAEHWPPPVSKIREGTYHVFKITPTWLRLGDFRDVKPNHESYFTQLIG